MHAFSPTFCKGPFLYTFSPIFVFRFYVRFHLYFVRVCLYVRFIHILLRSAFTCVFTDFCHGLFLRYLLWSFNLFENENKLEPWSSG